MKIASPLVVAMIAFVMCIAVVPNASAALSVSVSQSGADSDEVMKDSTFIVEATGWTGDCSTATISFDGCSGCTLSGEELAKSIGGGATSISWTTTSASNAASAQTVSVSVSSGCTLQQAASSNFDIVLPPSLSLSASTASSSVAAGGTFTANLYVVNNGETTANAVSFDVSGTGISASCDTISSIDEGQSAAQSCTVTATSAGSRTVTFTASATNAGSDSDSFTISVTGGGDDDDDGNGGGGGGTGVPTTDISEIITIGTIEAGATGTALFTDADLAVTEVAITANAAVSNVVVNTRQSSTMPDEVTVPTGSVYGYLTISALNIEEDNITSATIKFRVNRTWLSNNGVSQDDIVLLRFNNNAWEELSTTVASSDTTYVHYSAATPGFSVFAITAKAAVTPPDDGGADDTQPICTAAEKRCSGNLLQQCSSDGASWETTETCQYGCDAAALMCNAQQPGTGPGTGPSGTTAAADSTWIIIVVVAVIVIIIVVALFLRMRSGA